MLGLIETPRRLPNSITEAVLEKNKGGAGHSGRRGGIAGNQGLSGRDLERDIEMKKILTRWPLAAASWSPA